MTDLGLDQAGLLAGRALSGVLQARTASHGLAMDLADVLSGGAFTDVGVPPYSARFLTEAFRQVLTSPDRSPKALALRAVRHAEQSGRESLIQVSRRDTEGRWARCAHGTTCGFCTLLVSRGFVYHSERTGGFRSHDRCRCTAVPEFADDAVLAEVDRQRQSALDRYVQASRESGDTLANLRRLQEA